MPENLIVLVKGKKGMSNLLHVIRVNPKAMKKKSAIPLMVDVSVTPEAAPFLVSSSQSLMWIDQAHPGDIVKAAVRKITSPGAIFREVLETVISRGLKDNWGNVHPYSEEGVREAIRYLEFFDLTDVELLVPRTRSEKNEKGPMTRPVWLDRNTFDLPVHPTSWVPDGCVVVVPTDREFLGVLAHLSANQIMVILHNPSRGMAIARSEVQDGK